MTTAFSNDDVRELIKKLLSKVTNAKRITKEIYKLINKHIYKNQTNGFTVISNDRLNYLLKLEAIFIELKAKIQNLINVLK